MSLLFQQLIDVNTRELPNQNSALKYPCLLLMDEFTAIGKIGILSKGISYMAGYGLRWGIESFYGLNKTRLELENFTGNGAEAVRQDFHATVYLSGLESILTAPAQCVNDNLILTHLTG